MARFGPNSALCRTNSTEKVPRAQQACTQLRIARDAWETKATRRRCCTACIWTSFPARPESPPARQGADQESAATRRWSTFHGSVLSFGQPPREGTCGKRKVQHRYAHRSPSAGDFVGTCDHLRRVPCASERRRPHSWRSCGRHEACNAMRKRHARTNCSNLWGLPCVSGAIHA